MSDPMVRPVRRSAVLLGRAGNRCAARALLLVWAATAWAAPPATQPDAAERPLHRQHFAAYLSGQRVGYGVEQVRTLADGAFECAMDYDLTLKVEGAAVRLTMGARQVESADGAPLRIHSSRQLGPGPIVTDGEVRDGKLLLTTRQGNQHIRREQPWDGRVLFPEATRRRLAETLRADGDQTVIWNYHPDLPGTGIVAVTHRRIATERIELQGRAVQAIRVSESSPALPAVQHTWYDDDWRTLASELALGPKMVLRMEACSEAFALRRFDAPEVFNASLVRVDPPLPDAGKVRTLRLTLLYAHPLEQPLVLPQTERQRTVESTVQRLVIDLTRPDYPQPPDDAPPALTDELRAYTEPTDVYTSNDPAVRRAAEQAVRGRLDPLERARALRDWVDGHLAFKQMGVVQGTASDVLASRTGDCTEHAALLVALARALGIPARGVTGLVYGELADGRGLLGFHEWTQLYVRGRWVDFDAALGGEPASAARLALKLGRADGKIDMQDGGSSIYKLFGNVKSATFSQVTAETD